MNFVLGHDFICLTETFIASDFDSPLFTDFQVLILKAKKLSHHGRFSGGIIVLIRKKFASHVKQIDVKNENVIVVKIHKDLLSVNKDIMLVCTYIHPYDSPFWKYHQNGYGMEVLEQCLLDLQDGYDDFYLMLTGDFNARTANNNYSISDDDFDFNLAKASGMIDLCRRSQDEHTNMFGDNLLEICHMFDCIILNGLCQQIFDDGFTFISPSGASVVDYFLLSYELLSAINITAVDIENVTDSDHLPVVMRVDWKSDSTENFKESDLRDTDVLVEKIVWKDDKKTDFLSLLNGSNLQGKLRRAEDLLDSNVDSALELFTQCLHEASECMRIKCQARKKKKSEWFDEECSKAKKESRRTLNIFRRTRNEDDRLVYVTARKLYKKLLRTKRYEYRKQKAQSLADNISDSSLFWKELRSIGCGNKEHLKNNIKLTDWVNHFKGVFQCEEAEQKEHTNIQADLSDQPDHELNKEILEEEVNAAINKLKSGKAYGIDGITSEMLKNGNNNIKLFLVKLFNTIFNKGIYPKAWSKAIVIPIFKKGNPENVDNYRGISLLSILSKCYTSVLNTRLYAWLENNNMISENQAGFRKKYSTVDQVFNLYAIVQKCMSKKGSKLYVAFVDFKKAFDSVRHDKLIECIRSHGIKGKFFVSLIAMYESLLSCIRTNGQLSEFFECPVGVRQGCVLSPTLFSMFINQLATDITEKGKHGVQLLPHIMETFILLFADDVALLSTTPGGLQHQLNILQTCCSNMQLNVNIDKTKVMVFRKGGFLAKREQWSYNGVKLDVVNRYCYLGFKFTTKVSVKLGTEHLVTKGKKAVVQLNKAYQKYKEMNVNTFFKIFDVKIQPILLYSSEIWGLNRLNHIEKVHMMACKRFLGVPVRTPNKMIYGDLGRYPLYINSSINTLRYWFKLLTMDSNRLPYNAYQMLLELDRNGKECWVSKIRVILCETGFNIVWLQQTVGDVRAFLCIFKQRLVDMFMQEWYGTIRDRERYEIYRSFKCIFEREKYIESMDTYCYRVAITQARFNVLPLNNNVYRYSENVQDKACPFCKTKFENEVHFLLECSMYSDLRGKFLAFHRTIPLPVWLTSTNSDLRHNLSRFIFHSINRRKKLLEEIVS